MISDEEKLGCLRRELKMRERVYPSLIARDKMTADKSEYELSVMRAIILDYENRVQASRLV